MKRYLNTLFVTTQDTWLSKQGNVELHHDGQSLGTIPPAYTPVHRLLWPGKLQPVSSGTLCGTGRHGLLVFRERPFHGVCPGPDQGNVLLRRAQYRATDSPGRRPTLRAPFLIGKVANCRTILMRQARNAPLPALSAAIESLGHTLRQLRREDDLETLRGLEGDAARTYFGAFDLLIRPQCRAGGMVFEQRSRRPPMNEVNCLLSFLYTLLAHDIRSACESVGLDPAVGFLHRERPGRASLALDIMEEFRPYLADRLALSLINRQQLTAKDFIRAPSGAVTMKEKSRKRSSLPGRKEKRTTWSIPSSMNAWLSALFFSSRPACWPGPFVMIWKPIPLCREVIMVVLVSYDVNTQDAAGKRRLRRIARLCTSWGQRVQFSVFECLLDNAQWQVLRAQLLDEMDPERDSLRFYFLGNHWRSKIEHIGVKAAYDPEGPLIF